MLRDKMIKKKLFDLHSQFHRASQKARCRGSTSPLLDCMGDPVAPLEPDTLEFHRMYALSHLRPPLLYKGQSQSASRDHHCPAGCFLV